ncbi:MAG: hypothetical protein U5K74_08840 [Gemmatimonadaceae bacterium]|nr:hypothetical protein [Gemmatimonadaceae bacterium]
MDLNPFEIDTRQRGFGHDVLLWTLAGVVLALIATDRSSPFLYFQF